jgi:hypothetical protein
LVIILFVGVVLQIGVVLLEIVELFIFALKLLHHYLLVLLQLDELVLKGILSLLFLILESKILILVVVVNF